ncbi:MAG: hypothetical protein E7585_07910 [Ruminococcaceae bacterium]|nr:hypothetical protein [Oscillospiraceae bacterium]
MKNFARLLALLLACLMLVTLVVACDDTDDGPQGSEQVEDEYGREGDDLPELNYKNDVVSVLGWNCENPEFEIEQITSDNVNNALYDRNGEIERRLNVELKFTTEQGDVKHMKGFVALVDRVNGMNTHDFDIIASYSRTEGMLAIQGHLIDLKTINNGESYINLEKPWWPDNVIETVSIDKSMYFISGDISPNVLYLMQVIYFNKNLLDSYWNEAAKTRGYVADVDEKGKEIVSPASRMVYDMAYKGTWTIDELINLTRGANGQGTGQDTGDNKGVKDYKDQFGFASTAYQIDSFYTGSNLRLIEHVDDPTVVLKVSPDYGSFKTVKLVTKLGEWFKNDYCWADANGDSGQWSHSWNNGKTMFTAMRAHGVKKLDVSWDYGVLPVPKYDTKQANYYTCMGNPFTLYGIFEDLKVRGDRTETLLQMSAVLECWASETYRLVTPEVFEVNMQLKYADTQYETDMFEIIRSSVVFDLGRIFANDMAYMSELPSRTAVNGASWASTFGAYKKSLDTKLAQIVESLV